MKDENGNGLPDFFEDFENWKKLADTDDDGLPDSIEEYLGSDANNIDTDNDGLNDYYEIFDTYTDPTKADTDENGVDDGEEDFDGDGLTNIQEFANETYPYDDDSDFDGLFDGDEVNVYITDPLIADTDGEGLLDGDEIVLGTDPLVQDTDADGTLDCDEKFNQTFTHKVANEDCAVTEVSVTMDCTGNINRTTSIDSVMNIDILSSEVVGLIGEPFEIETISEFDAATIAFKVDTEKLGDTEFDNLLFLWYDEENSKFVELETILDEENGIVSTVTTHFSKYMIVDSRTWYDAWRTNLDYSGGLEAMPVDTVLVIDKSGSMDYSDIDMITDAANCYIDTMKQGDRAAIVTFASSASLRYALTDNKIELSKSLSGITPGGGTNFDAAILKALSVFDDDSRTRIVIFMSDGEDSVATTTLTKIDESGVIFHTVGYGSANSTYLKDISKAGKGEYYEALYQEDLVEIYTDLSLFYNIDKTDTDGDGLYDAVETAGIRLLNGKIIYGCDPSDPDTDDDGLLDGQEIDSKPLLSPYTKVTDEHVVGYYFLMESDPTRIDTDFDYYEDGNESNRKKWEATKLYDELIDDSKSIYGTNPSTDTAFRLNGTLSRMPIGEGSIAVKNVYNFQRSSNFLYEHNSNYTSTFEILPEKKGVYAITVTNVSNIYDVDIKVESEKKDCWGNTVITEVIQIDQEPLVGNNQVTFYYELKNLSPNVYNPVAYYIYIDNNVAASYNVLISQDNWVYAPYGGYIHLTGSYYTNEMYYTSSESIYSVIKDARKFLYNETLEDNFQEYLEKHKDTPTGISDFVFNELCLRDAELFARMQPLPKDLDSAMSDIGNFTSISGVVLMLFPQLDIISAICTVTGGATALYSLYSTGTNSLQKAMFDGEYNVVFSSTTSEFSLFSDDAEYTVPLTFAWTEAPYINRYAPNGVLRDKVIVFDTYRIASYENGGWNIS